MRAKAAICNKTVYKVTFVQLKCSLQHLQYTRRIMSPFHQLPVSLQVFKLILSLCLLNHCYALVLLFKKPHYLLLLFAGSYSLLFYVIVLISFKLNLVLCTSSYHPATPLPQQILLSIRKWRHARVLVVIIL